MCALKLDLPPRTWNRRAFLKTTTGAALAWPVLGIGTSAFARQSPKLGGYPFTLGVASGDPTPDGFVLWTRLAPAPLEGGGMPHENVEVAWQVTTDEAMTKVVVEGTTVATPDLAHSIHVEVPGLEPDRWYFYRFKAAGEISPVGRARTMPAAGTTPDRLRFAFASCQHFESGLFTAYRHAATEGLDLIAHLGDYIYEGAGNAKRMRTHVGPLLDQLEDYRNRHAQYKTDEHLQLAHAHCPWIVTFDDHEIANNFANDIPDRKQETTEGLLRKRTNGFQAYFEHMPLRAAQLPSGPDIQMYRRLAFGDLVEFSVLDTRQYRTDQPCGDGNRQPCEETFDPNGTIMGEAQERWLYEGMNASRAVWNTVAQQVMMGRVDRAPGDVMAYSMDQWPGYEANRQRLLKFFAERPKLNPIVLTGDIHSNWANNLQINEQNPDDAVVATEFVGTSIASGGDGAELPKNGKAVLSENPFVKFFNTERGYVVCDVTPTQWKTHYRTVPFVTKPDAPLVTRKSFVVERDQPGLKEV
jgi:alkaline phosphatase D